MSDSKRARVEHVISRDGKTRVEFHAAEGGEPGSDGVVIKRVRARRPLVDLRGSGWTVRGMFNPHDERLTLYLYATPTDAMGLEAEFDFATGGVRVVRRERDGAPIMPGRTFDFGEFARLFGAGGPERRRREEKVRGGVADLYWEED